MKRTATAFLTALSVLFSTYSPAANPDKPGVKDNIVENLKPLPEMEGTVKGAIYADPAGGSAATAQVKGTIYLE